ncbi:hypothetical protein HanIR_Chr15g0762441 [Helianthus annuus]|nr:hypothetical protein HanIR_Chr15g0762441 [Helianthus annuus]
MKKITFPLKKIKLKNLQTKTKSPCLPTVAPNQSQGTMSNDGVFKQKPKKT